MARFDLAKLINKYSSHPIIIFSLENKPISSFYYEIFYSVDRLLTFWFVLKNAIFGNFPCLVAAFGLKCWRF